MADEKPGTTVETPAQNAPETQSAAAPPPAAVKVETPADPYAEFPEEIREKVKDREAKAKEAALNEYRAKAGAEGGWLSQVPPELREEFKKDPQALWRYKAEAEAYKAVVGHNGSVAQPDVRKKSPEDEVQEWLDAQVAAKPDMTVQEFSKVTLQAQAKLARAIAEETAVSRSKSTYSEMSLAERQSQVEAQPEMQNFHFATMYDGIRARLKRSGKPDDPYTAYGMAKHAWAELFPNAPVNNRPVPEEMTSPADTKRTPVNPAPTPALSPIEKWRKSPGARHLKDD